MKQIKRTHIAEVTDKLVYKAAFHLRPDVLHLLEAASDGENGPARKALEQILENAEASRKDKRALCQDTGLPIVFIDWGGDACVDAGLVAAVKQGVEDAYERYGLRPSMVDPLERGTPRYQGALVHCRIDPGIDGIKLTLLQKGFGSENKSRLCMFNPTASLEELEDFVVETVSAAGPEACPPFIIGVGIGGTSDTALLSAKEALLKKVDKREKGSIGDMEERLMKKINALNIGPMGYGGRTTALSVKIRTQPTHIAGLPVGVNISCWALRTATVTL